jgi:alkylation response protein AidB-like acyl-CoA dehydrogenase
MITLDYQQAAKEFLTKHLKPLVTAIDEDAIYPEDVLKEIGRSGLYGNPNSPCQEFWSQTLGLIEETAAFCGSTAFSLWCHTTAMIYIRNGSSTFLKEEILPRLATGEVLGASGLSNPIKFYADMESIRLHAKKVSGGCVLTGFLPFVSNLGKDHWFGIVAQVDENRRIIALVPCFAEGLEMTERKDFLGLNGSATYNCRFQNVFIPNEWILDEDADSFIKRIREEFVLNQTGLGLGLARAAIRSIRTLQEKQGGANQYLRHQPDELETRLNQLRDEAYTLIHSSQDGRDQPESVLRVRLESAYLALDAASAGMLHCGGGAYVKKSSASRRLREAYFVAVVTPAVKQLEKLLQVGWRK